MEKNLSSRRWLCGAAACLASAAVMSGVSTQAQLVVGFQGGTTISSTSPSIVMTVENNSGSPIDIGGVNFFVQVGGGTSGPTIDTSAPSGSSLGPGVDLIHGTLFQNNNFGQSPSGTEQPRSQGWGVGLSTPYTLAANTTVQLGTITFNSFPLGTYSLDFTQPSTTTFSNSDGSGFIPTTLPNGATVTVVPEPNSAVAAGVLLGLFGLWRWKRVCAA